MKRLFRKIRFLFRRLTRRFMEVELVEYDDQPPSKPSTKPGDSRRKQRNRKRDAKRLRRGIQRVFKDCHSLPRSMRRALSRMPPVNLATSSAVGRTMEGIEGFRHLAWLSPELKVERRVSSIDACFMAIVHDNDDKEKEVGWYIMRARRVGAKALRGRCRIVPPWTLTTEVISKEGGKSFHWSQLLASIDGNDWRYLTKDGRFIKDKDELDDRMAKMHMSEEITSRYTWKVIFRSKGISAFLPVDAVGARELLMLRDANVGGKRRSPISHIVMDHNRRLPNGKVVRVKAHLRGALSCQWRGWEIEVVPSDHDVQHLEEQETVPDQDLMTHLKVEADRLETLPPAPSLVKEENTWM